MCHPEAIVLTVSLDMDILVSPLCRRTTLTPVQQSAMLLTVVSHSTFTLNATPRLLPEVAAKTLLAQPRSSVFYGPVL